MFGKKKTKNKVATPLPKDIKPTGEVKPDVAPTRQRKGTVKNVLSGDALVPLAKQHYTFVLYCCVLIMLYMGYVFSSQRLQRREIECRIELQRVRAKSLIYSSERIEASRHSTIVKEVEQRGLQIKEWPTPPQTIGNNERTKTK